MQRVTLTLDDELIEELDPIIERRGYQNRSEAIRDLARAGIKQTAVDTGGIDHCVAALVYVYDHNVRELARRLTQTYHDHHDLSVATLHVHLDHESCLEVTVLKGNPGDVQHCADHVIAERSVRYGQLVLIPVETAVEAHAHGHGEHRHEHIHIHRQKD